MGIDLRKAGLDSWLASAVRFFPYYSPFHACLSSTTEEHGSTKSCALSPLALCARPLHIPLEPHLNLVTVLEGKVCLPVLLTPRAILLRIAHDGVDIPMAVEARVEVQHEVAAVLPYVHSKPGETGGAKVVLAQQLQLPNADKLHLGALAQFTTSSLTLWHQTGSSL